MSDSTGLWDDALCDLRGPDGKPLPYSDDDLRYLYTGWYEQRLFNQSIIIGRLLATIGKMKEGGGA